MEQQAVVFGQRAVQLHVHRYKAWGFRGSLKTVAVFAERSSYTQTWRMGLHSHEEEWGFTDMKKSQVSQMWRVGFTDVKSGVSYTWRVGVSQTVTMGFYRCEEWGFIDTKSGVSQTWRVGFQTWRMGFHRHKRWGFTDMNNGFSQTWRMGFYRHEEWGFTDTKGGFSQTWRVGFHRHEAFGFKDVKSGVFTDRESEISWIWRMGFTDVKNGVSQTWRVWFHRHEEWGFTNVKRWVFTDMKSGVSRTWRVGFHRPEEWVLLMWRVGYTKCGVSQMVLKVQNDHWKFLLRARAPGMWQHGVGSTGIPCSVCWGLNPADRRRRKKQDM